MNKIAVPFVLLILLISGSCALYKSPMANDGAATAKTAKTFIAYDHALIQYEGRVPVATDYAGLYWSGTTMRINFKGTGLNALMEDEKGQNYYNVIVDGKVLYKLKMDTAKKWYRVVDNLPDTKHTLELFKITQAHKEYGRGYTKFYGVELNEGGTMLPPPTLKKRKMEFYGNSVTCGHAIEDTTGGDSGAPKFENNYLSYAALTARHYNAQYSCIAKSGIGLMVSWAPAIMPEMYHLGNPYDSTSIWNFSKYTPDIVVVNLFQNDAGIINRKDFKEFIRRFGSEPPTEEFIIKSYQSFIQNLRSKYPKAHIICTLGSMSGTMEGSIWPVYIRKAVANLKDDKVYTHFFPYKNTPGHPRVNEHKTMAESLIRYIDANIKW